MSSRSILPAIVALVGVASLLACAPKPVLYPTPHYQAVGKAAADAAVDECLELAKASGVESRSGRGQGAARRTAAGAASGAVGGAVGGAIWGNAGRGAASGAAGGAAVGLFSSLFSRPGPSPAYQNFVNRCLAERGFDTMGWQ
ncbi:glycine zipper family protein [Methylobacterium sp.]|uniref:glycine zipper family protein n=1 Tax=Methylobacterium sp. TaxID=409 RepID=UPI003B015D76